MSEYNLEGIESLRITAEGNLRIKSSDGGRIVIDCNQAPEVSRDGGNARVRLDDNAEVRVPAGVSVTIAGCHGNLDAEDCVAPMAVDDVGGNFRARRVGAISVRSSVGGNLSVERGEMVDVGGAVGGSLVAEKIEKLLRTRTVGGKLDVERAGTVDVEVVGGKVRVERISGAVRIGSVGGKLSAEDVSGEIVIEEIGGHAYVTRAGGSVDLPNIGGVAELRGPFAPSSNWHVRTRGRISLELDRESSIKLSANCGWGRIRVFGGDEVDLSRSERGRATGMLGVARPDAERTNMNLETTSADIIISSAGAHGPRSHHWRGGRYGFGAPWEDFAAEIGREIPGFVGSILDATGKIVAESGGFAHNITEGVGRSMRDVLDEVERMLDEVDDAVPREVGERLAEKCREIGRMIRRAAEERRWASRESREAAQERIREAARDLRETIREAVRKARERENGASTSTSTSGAASDLSPAGSGASATASAAGRTQVFTPEARQRDILDILNKVKRGEIEPDEADDMIAALMEVEQTTQR